MAKILLRPDLKTPGGEVHDILLNDRYVGTLTLVYRDSDRIAGSMQLEEDVLTSKQKDKVSNYVHEYIQSLITAMNVRECEVMVTHSSFDHVIATPVHNTAAYDRADDYTDDEFDQLEWIDDELLTDDRDQEEDIELNMRRASNEDPGSFDDEEFELYVAQESRSKVEYHVYKGEQQWVAEAFMRLRGREMTGTVEWFFEPSESDLDQVADLIVYDFDENEVDSFVIDMKFEDEILETIELTHEELLEESTDVYDSYEDELVNIDESDIYPFLEASSDDYTIVLARDDGDVLTYEIYEQSRGGLPIGTATVDISQRQITGFIDFREPGNSDDRELIASLLMQELDKEKDFETMNLSMMHRNRLIEEVLFETESVH